MTPNSTIKHRPINKQGYADPNADAIMQDIRQRNPRASRKASPVCVTVSPQEDDNEEDDAMYYSNFRGNRHSTTQANPTQNKAIMRQPEYYGKTTAFEKRRIHWLLPTGITMLVLFFGWLLIGTYGASFWIEHFTSDNGPTHGSILTFTPKAGAQPESIIAVNRAGQIEVFVVPSSIKNTKIYEGIDLIKSNFPQATRALVTLSTGDFNADGIPDIQVQILSYTFNSPFHRITTTYLLINDGNGNFKQQTPAIIA